MKTIYIAASIILLALSCPAYSAEGETGGATTSSSSGKSVGQSIKSTAQDIGHGIKSGARQFKRSVAVARCNNGEYSYTHYKTCNQNGGVREKFW